MIGIVDFGSSKVPYILACVEDLGFEGEIYSFSDSNFNPTNWKKVVFSGAPILLSQIADKEKYINFTRTVLGLDIPVLGICFGHQILGMAHGAECKMGKEDRAEQQICQLTSNPIFENLDKEFEMQQDHCEFIDVPNDFIHLASSKITFNEVMKHQTKPLYGCQFHPEVSGENGRNFILNFLSQK